MKTTVDLPNDLVREMKLRAVNEGKKLRDVVADLIRRGLGRDDAARVMSPRKGHIDVPLFPTAADAPVSHMTIGEIIAAEQQSLFGEDVRLLAVGIPKVWMDAYLAAFAIIAGLELVCLDKDFRTFERHGLALRMLIS